jgi:hypothetical protein
MAFEHLQNNLFMDVTIEDIKLDWRVLKSLYKFGAAEGKLPEGNLAGRCSETMSSELWKRSMVRLSDAGLIEFGPAFNGLLRSVNLTQEGKRYTAGLMHESEADRNSKGHCFPKIKDSEVEV